MKISHFIFNRISVNTYLVSAPEGEAVIIDPGCCDAAEERTLLQAVEKEGCRISHLLLTHAHADHIQGCEWVKKTFPEAVLAAHPDCAIDYERANAYGGIFGFPERCYPPIDRFLSHGDEIRFGSISLQVLHTPGHAKGCVCYYAASEKALFSGDTLFQGSVGRTDLPGGSQQELRQSLRNILATLPPETRVFCGHGGETTIGEERTYNPYFTF
jgi:glyoxylase-like metal-dependent hydrolase (beta-lactamase superfamily II)